MCIVYYRIFWILCPTVGVHYNIAIERLYLLCPETVTEVKALTKEYIVHYNNERGHQRHDYETPAAVFYENQTLTA